jgi:D-3-phosphoglycerate dehydrogenase
MTKRWNVIVSAPYLQPVLDRFLPALRDAGINPIVPVVHERLSEDELLPIVGDADGVICGDDRFTRRVLTAARRLKVISKWGTGIDSIDRDACRDLGIRVCNTPGAFTQPVADSVFGYLLAFARRQPWMDRQMKQGIWDKIPGRTLGESTLGVIGVGDIGREVTRRARAFGMTVLGCDPRQPPEDFVAATGIEMTARDDLLRRSDFVTLHTDLNPTSHHLIDERALSQMKSTAVLINTSRGPVVHEAALVDALKARRIAGAGLDVFEVEPLPLDSPLMGMENVMLAPHNSNSSPAAWERVHHNTIRNLLRGLEEVQRWAA